MNHYSQRLGTSPKHLSMSSDHQCKVKMSGSEKKVNNNMYNILSIKCVTKKFLEVSHCSHPKQQKRNVQKKGAACAKLLF